MLKLAFTVATPEVKSTSLKAYCGPLEASLSALAELGYEGVELMVRSPREIDIGQVEQLLNRYSLIVPVVGTGQLESEDHLTLTDPNPEGRQATVARLKEVVDFAGTFGAQVNLGRIRGRLLPDFPPEDSRKRMKESLLQVLEHADRRNVRLILEPQNKSIINWINTVPEALSVIEEIGHENLGTMVDTYHANLEERSIAGALVRAGHNLWYVHAADSNGCAPGQGHLNFPEILDIIRAIHYEGFVTVEVSQVPDHRTSAKQAIEYLAAIG